MRRLLIAVLLVAAMAMPAIAGNLVAPAGYNLSEVTFTGFVGGFDVAPNGNFIVFEGQNVYEVTKSGSFVQNLYTFEDSVWGSFVRVDAAENRVYFGESGGGYIKSVGLDGSDVQDVARVPFNYDFALNPNGDAFVVAGSSVYLLGESGADEIACASGASGPLAFDSDGNLFYGTASSSFGEAGGQSIVEWTASQVAGAVGTGVLTVDDGVTLLDDIDGPSGFAMDGSALYYTQSVQYPGRIMCYKNGASSLFATADTDAGYSWLTSIRTNSSNGAISVLVGTPTSTTISTLTPVPEPGSLLALALGLGGLFVRRRK